MPALPSFKKILCPVDLSDASAAAFRYAQAVREKFAGKLSVLHVVPAPAEYYNTIMPEYATFVSRAQRTAEAQLNSFTADWKGRFEKVILTGKGYYEILRYARREKAGLVVLGAKGISPIVPLLMGGTAERVIREAPCPVLTVRQPAPPFQLRKILFPVDFSKEGMRAAPYALTLAQKFKATIYLLHVVELLEGEGAEVEDFVSGKYFEALQKKLIAKLGSGFKRVKVEKVVQRYIDAGHYICRFAEEQGMDLIVMATHGRRRLARLVVGSIAEKVVRNSVVPVLTVRE